MKSLTIKSACGKSGGTPILRLMASNFLESSHCAGDDKVGYCWQSFAFKNSDFDNFASQVVSRLSRSYSARNLKPLRLDLIYTLDKNDRTGPIYVSTQFKQTESELVRTASSEIVHNMKQYNIGDKSWAKKTTSHTP